MTTISISADSAIGRQLLADEAAQSLRMRKDLWAKRQAAQQALRDIGPEQQARVRASEKAVADAEQALRSAQQERLRIAAEVAAAMHPHERAIDVTGNQLRMSASPILHDFRKELQRLRQGNIVRSDTTETDTSSFCRTNADAVREREEAIAAAIAFCADLELLPLTEAELHTEIGKLRDRIDRVDVWRFGDWFASWFK